MSKFVLHDPDLGLDFLSTEDFVASTVSVVLTETVGANSFLNIFSNAGILSARLANNSDPQFAANAYTQIGGAIGTSLIPIFSGLVTVNALSANTDYFTGINGGVITSANVPSGTGMIIQKVGRALSTTQFLLAIESPYRIE